MSGTTPAGLLHRAWGRWIAPAAASGVGRNSFYSALGFAVPAIGLLIFTPLLLNGMGTSGYGLWVLSTSFLGLMGVFDLGLSTAVAKYVAQYDAEGDVESLSSSVTMGTALYLVLGVVLSSLAFLAAPVVASLFDNGGASAQTVSAIFRVAALGLLPSFLKNAAGAVPLGLQRFQVLMVISISQTVLTLGLATLVVYAGGSVLAAVASAVVSLWIVALASLVVAHRMFRASGGRPQWAMSRLREIARYLLFTSATGVGMVLFSSLDRLAVGAVAGVTAVAYYSVSVGIAVNLLSVADVLSRPLMPAASSWVGTGQWDRVRRWLRRSTLAIASLESLMAVVLLAASRPFLTAWLGEDFATQALIPFRILIVAYAIIAVAAPSYHIANGVGYPWVPALGSTMGGALTVVLIMLLTPNWGVAGAAWANFAYCLNLAMLAYMSRIVAKRSSVTEHVDLT